MAVSVVGDSESTKDLIRSRGLTPGKTKSGSVSRSSSGKRTTRSASGEVEKTEEKVTIDGNKFIKTTTFNDVDLKSAPGSETNKIFYQDTGSQLKQLTPFESFGLQTRGGGASTEQGEVFYTAQAPQKRDRPLFKESFYRDYPYLAAQKEAEVREQIFSPATATVRKIANTSAFQFRIDQSLKNRVLTASNPQNFEESLINYRSNTQYNLLTDRESYGNIESKNPFKSVIGAFSLGAKTIGGATESLLFEQEAKIKYKDRQAIGQDETGSYSLNILKDGSRDFTSTTLKASRNLIGGAVTDLGTSRTQALVFAASFGLGGLLGASTGAGITSKIAAASKSSVYTRSFVKGTSIGLKTLGYGALTYAGAKAVTSGDPVASLSRLGGQLISFSGAFKVGEATGYYAGLGASNTASAISKKLSEVTINLSPRPLGKKAAAFRGNRRVSPPSKVSISKQNKGITQKQQKGARISKNKGETIIKIRDKATKQYFQEQIKGSQVKEVRLKGKADQYKLTESGKKVLSKQGNVRAEVHLKRGDFFKVDYVNKPGFRKPVKVSKPIYSKSTGTTASGNQLFKTVRNQIPSKPVSTVQKTVRINDQKQLFIKSDPARSVYSAQNIKSDPLKLDITSAPSSAPSSKGGFRGGISKGSIVGQDRINYLKSDLRDLTGASLPGGNVPKTSFLVAEPISKTRNLIFGIPIADQSINYKSSSVQAQAPAFLSSQVSQSAFLTAQSFKVDTIQSTGSAEKTSSLFDQAQAIIPRSTSRSRPSSGGGGSFLPKPSPTFETPITPSRSTPPRTPFTPRTSKTPPTNPVKIIPPFFKGSRKRDSITQGYNVEARIGGVFKKISRSPLSLGEAIGFGSSIVGSTSAATFRVSKSSQEATGRFKGLSQIRDFERRPGGLFVEKDEKRINTLGELIGITRKGQLAQRTRGIFK